MSKSKNGYKVGDLIEFLSDKQTKKGPSSGSIIEIDTVEKSDIQIGIVVKHSNHPGEWFPMSHLEHIRTIERDDGKILHVCA